MSISHRHRLAAWLGPKKCAWAMWAIGTFFNMGSSPGQTPVIGVFIEFLIEDLRLTRTLISTLYLAATCTSSCTVPFVGAAIDSRGLHRVASAVSLGLGLTCFYMGLVSPLFMPWTLLVGFFLLRFFGQGSMTLCGSNLINQWWSKQRGFMVGLTGVALALTMTGFFPTLFRVAAASIGWQETYMLLGTVLLLLHFPLALFAILHKPEEYNMRPDGESIEGIGEAEEGGAKGAGAAAGGEASYTRGQALRQPVFWAAGGSLFVWAMLATAVFFWIPGILAEGVPEEGARRRVLGAMYATSSIVSACATVPAGRLLDRKGWKAPMMIALCGLIGALTCIPWVTSVATAVPVFFMFGFGNGCMNNLSQTVMAKLFGREHLGKISGISQSMLTFGSALGPLLFGYFKDSTGTFSSVMHGSIAFPCAAMLAVILAPSLDSSAVALQYEMVPPSQEATEHSKDVDDDTGNSCIDHDDDGRG